MGTPANNAPISSHAQQPGVGTIKEEEFDRAAAASIFAQNPKLVQMIQGKLGSLVGRSSGYVESLPAPVRRRVAGLKGVQKEHSKLEAEFQEEVLELEKKYFAKFTPLYQKRATIINGTAEPTEAEIKAGEEDEEVDDEPVEKSEEASDVKGIPEFWLSAMKNQVSLAEMITDRDEAALKDLTDVRMEYLDKPGFRLIFEFAENEFFTNKIVTKTYFYQTESGYGGDFIYDHAEGDKIDWKTGKDLTVRIESKKQRNKNTKQPEWSRRLSQPSPSSTSSPHHWHQPRRTTMMRLPISRSVWSLIINLVRISRRSLFLVPSIGLPERPFNLRSRTMMMMLRSPSRRLLSASKVKCYNAFLYPTITPPNSHSLHHIRPTCMVMTYALAHFQGIQCICGLHMKDDDTTFLFLDHLPTLISS